MIAKHSLGQGFYGLLSYVLREGMPGREAEARLLGGNMSGQYARELACEFAVFHDLNRAVRRPVFHAALRLPVGESLTDAQWREAAAEYLTQLGYTDAAYIVARHPERHIHLVASRVRFDGTVVDAWQDRWRSLAAVAAIERRFGLAQPRRPAPGVRDRRTPRMGSADSTRSRRLPACREIPAGHPEEVLLENAGGGPASASMPLGGAGASMGPWDARLVGAARDTLAQQHRWNGHLDEEAMARLAATQLIGRFPQVSVSTVLAALGAAQPGILARHDGGEAALATQLGGLIEARLAASACMHEEGEYPTR